MVTPDYYDKFACIGGECKHTCCGGAWDIEIDDESYEKYRRMGGEFGEKLISSITDERVFVRRDGKCAMLSPDGLCEIVCHGGEFCVTCGEYPRFTQYYDDYVERGLSLSCEVAVEIVLNNREKVEFTGRSGTCDEELFPMMFAARETILGILQNREFGIGKRIRLVLDYGEKLQEKINRNDFTEFICVPEDRKSAGTDIGVIYDVLSDMAVMNDGWLDAVRTAGGHKNVGEVDGIAVEQLAVYFIYRYFLDAVYDCDAISKIKFMAVSTAAIVGLSDVCGSITESARLYSLEIEHNEDNIDLFCDEFIFNEEFSTENIINMI